MDRTQASELLRADLNKYGLNDWKIRITTDPNLSFLGLCMPKDKCIMLNAHHIDIHPYAEVVNTIHHEVAHALTIGHGHDDVWATKAREIGCDNTNPCSHLSLPDHVIDAIRSGHTVEVIVEEKIVEQVIRNVTHKVTRLQDKCPECGKVAVEKFAINTVDKEGNDVKLITLECFHIIKKIIPRGTPFDTMVSFDWKPEIKNCKHKWTKNQCDVCGQFKLYNFQVTGAQFAEAGLATQKGVGIFDDMGLGKTIQALAILRFHADKYSPTMVVTKSAIKFQWFKKAVEWLGPDFISQIISTSRDYLMPGLKLYIIPYDLLRRFPREKLHKLGIKLVILDEVQQIKNPDSSRTQEVRKLVSAQENCKVIELSGTPWKNRGGEFFPALNLLDPIKFFSYQHYLDTDVEYYYEGAKKKMGGIRNIKKFKEKTAQLIIRREYEEVMDEFPEVNRMKLNVQLDELSQSTYDDSVSDFVEWYNNFVIGGEEDAVSGIEILAKMSRMRHITGLAKIPATLGFVEEFVEDTQKKLVIFVHHKDVGQLMINALRDCNPKTNPDWHELAQSLVDQNITVFQYTSAHTGRPEGYDIQENFNKTKRCIMVASTLACGEGLDLQTCADTIMHERQWNPQNEDQAAPGRFRRIGQTAKVIGITFPEAEGTIDEHLDGIVEQKRRQFYAGGNKNNKQVWNEGEIGKKLAEIIVAKHKQKKVKQGKSEVKTNITAAATF
jgi:SNF2 family DNA or RNA helicase